jgi:hypothetical protein
VLLNSKLADGRNAGVIDLNFIGGMRRSRQRERDGSTSQQAETVSAAIPDEVPVHRYVGLALLQIFGEDHVDAAIFLLGGDRDRKHFAPSEFGEIRHLGISSQSRMLLNL